MHVLTVFLVLLFVFFVILVCTTSSSYCLVFVFWLGMFWDVLVHRALDFLELWVCNWRVLVYILVYDRDYYCSFFELRRAMKRCVCTFGNIVVWLQVTTSTFAVCTAVFPCDSVNIDLQLRVRSDTGKLLEDKQIDPLIPWLDPIDASV